MSLFMPPYPHVAWCYYFLWLDRAQVFEVSSINIKTYQVHYKKINKCLIMFRHNVASVTLMQTLHFPLDVVLTSRQEQYVTSNVMTCFSHVHIDEECLHTPPWQILFSSLVLITVLATRLKREANFKSSFDWIKVISLLTAAKN